MNSWRIDVKNKAGTTTYGSVEKIVSWESDRIANKGGRFQLRVPIDGVEDALLQKGRYVYLYETTGSDTEWAAGIIEKRTIVVQPGASIQLHVEGQDLTQELNFVRTGNLVVANTGSRTPVYVEHFAKNSSTSTHLPNVYDGNTGTSNTVNWRDDSFLYIGHHQPILSAAINVGATNLTEVGSLVVEVFTAGGQWLTPTGISDGTAVGSRPFQQDGTISWDDVSPQGWSKETHNGRYLHWIRIGAGIADPDGGDDIQFVEITINTRIATTACLAPVIALATGWSLATNTTTANGVVHQFTNDTVLGALNILHKLSGENWRLGTGKQIQWLRGVTPDSGITAKTNDGISADEINNPENYCYITRFEQVDYPVEATRIVAEGAGLGGGKITMSLADTSLVPLPSGYTLDTGASRLINGTAETALGYSIEKNFRVKELSTVYSSGDSKESSTQLLQAAIEYLKRASAADRVGVNMAVTGLLQPLLPLDTIDVVYNKTYSGSGVYSFNDTVVMLEIKTRIDSTGAVFADIVACTSDQIPETFEQSIATRMQESDTVARYRQPITSYDVDGMPGSGGGVTPFVPGSYVTPTEMADYVTGLFSTHTADEDAHHNRQHGILSGDDHTVTGSAGQVIGLTADNTLGLLDATSDGRSNPGDLLITDAGGDLILRDLDVRTLVSDGGVFVDASTGAFNTFEANTNPATGLRWLRAASQVGLSIVHQPFAGTQFVVQNTDATFPNLTLDFKSTNGDIYPSFFAGGEGDRAVLSINAVNGGSGTGFAFWVYGTSYGSAGAAGGLSDIRGIPSILSTPQSDGLNVAALAGPLYLGDEQGQILNSNNSSQIRWHRSLLPHLTDTYDLGTEDYKWRKGWLSEIEAELFAKNIRTLMGGWFVVPHQSGTLPAAVADTDTQIDFGSDVTIQANDIIEFRGLSGGLPIVEYIRATSLAAGTTWNVTRNLDGTGANDWPAEQVFWVKGQVGDGWLDLDAQNGAPHLSIWKMGNNYNNQVEIVRIGDINGLAGISSTTYGMYAGDSANNFMMFRSDTNVLELSGTIKAQAGEIAGTLTIGASGKLEQLNGSNTGIRIRQLSGIGRVEGLTSGVVQVSLGSDGKLKAGQDEAVVLDYAGLAINDENVYWFDQIGINEAASADTNDRSLKFMSRLALSGTTDTEVGSIRAYTEGVYDSGATQVDEYYTRILHDVKWSDTPGASAFVGAIQFPGHEFQINGTEVASFQTGGLYLPSGKGVFTPNLYGFSGAVSDISVQSNLDLQDGKSLRYDGDATDRWITPSHSWTSPASFSNGWKSLTGYLVRYRRLPDGNVQMAGLLDVSGVTSSNGSNSIAFNLPSPLRPTNRIVIIHRCYNDETPVQINIQTDGDVYVMGVSTSKLWISLDGILFDPNTP